MKQFLIVLTPLLLSATGAMALDPVNTTWAGIDPVAWKIVDDKLYLNYSK